MSWDRPWGEALLTPTRIYVKQILAVASSHRVKGIAHITGGGITENLPRIFPKGCVATIRRSNWPVPPVFRVIQKLGQIQEEEMYRVFNMGIGLALVVPAEEAPRLIAALAGFDDQAWVIGEIAVGPSDARSVSYVG